MMKRTVMVAVGTMLAVTVVVAHGPAGRTASMSEGQQALNSCRVIRSTSGASAVATRRAMPLAWP
jgi:hypothetical protein